MFICLIWDFLYPETETSLGIILLHVGKQYLETNLKTLVKKCRIINDLLPADLSNGFSNQFINFPAFDKNCHMLHRTYFSSTYWVK